MKGKKKTYIICGALGIIIIGVLMYLAITYLPRLQTGNEIANVLRPVLEAENQSMKLDVEADFAEESFELEAEIYLVNEGDVKFFVLDQNEYPLYIVDNILFMQNGKAYKIAEQMQTQVLEYQSLFIEIAAAYELFEITKTETDNETCYEIVVTGEQAATLLEAMMPTDNELIRDIENIYVKLITSDEQLNRVEVSGGANVNDAAVQVLVTISDFKVLSEGEYTIPDIIKESLKTVDQDALFNLTEDLYRLIVGVNKFSDFENINGTVSLYANLGVLQMSKEVDLAQLKEGLSDVENPEDIQEIPAVIAFLCMEGDISCVEIDGKYVYTLSLNQDSMKKIASSIAPEIVNYVVNLTEGIAEVVIEDGSVSNMSVDIKGGLNLLVTEFPVEVGAEFIFE